MTGLDDDWLETLADWMPVILLVLLLLLILGGVEFQCHFESRP